MIDKSPILRQCHKITPTSQDSNTPEGLESRFSVGIHRIPIELLHSTEWIPAKLLRSSYSTRTNLGRTLEAKLTLSARRSRGYL
jgi:hypothetical protein